MKDKKRDDASAQSSYLGPYRSHRTELLMNDDGFLPGTVAEEFGAAYFKILIQFRLCRQDDD